MTEDSEQTEQKKAAMLKALKESRGNVSVAVEKANCGRTQHYQWLIDDDDYKEAVSDISESLIDNSESNILKRANGYKYEEVHTTTEKNKAGETVIRTTKVQKIMPPNVDANAKYLAAKARERGWGTKIEIGGMKDTPPVPITAIEIVTRDDKNKGAKDTGNDSS